MAIKVGALWVRKYTDKKDGQEKNLISGRTEYVIIPPGASLVLNKNTDKKNEKSPDFYLMVDEPYQGGHDHKPSNPNMSDIPF